MRLIRLGVTVAVAALVGQTQTFEVASVKPSTTASKRESGGGPGSREPGQYHFNRASMQDLIAVAYKVDRFQISSKVPLDKDYFDIVAKVPPSTSRDDFHQMLQSLLTERFRLKLHKESHEFQAYELMVARNGPKLKESTADAPPDSDAPRPKFSPDSFPQLPPDRPGFSTFFSTKDGATVVRMSAQQQTMSALVGNLRGPDDPPIVDKTGLTGKYDFRLEYSRPIPMSMMSGSDSLVPDVFSALPKQLGLQLVPKKLSFDVLVIESFDKVPAEN